MTFLDFEQDLAEEIKEILKEVSTTNAAGQQVSGVSVYRHDLPLQFSDDVRPILPCAVVRVYEGQTADDDDCWHVVAGIHLGTYDESADNHGHEDLLIMIQRIVDRFAADPSLKEGIYRAEQDIGWEIQDSDVPPMFYGSVALKFYVPKIERSTLGYDHIYT